MKRIALRLGMLASFALALLPLEASAQTRLQTQAQTVQALNGSNTYLGTLVASSSVNNSSTATPFTIVAGQLVLVQCDAAAYLLPGTSSSAAVTTANGVKVAADEKYWLMLKTSQPYLAAIALTGTANCKVWRLD